MAKFIFRLQGFLKVKEKLEEQKKLEYGKAIRKLEEEREKKRQLAEELEGCIIGLRQELSSGIKPEDFLRRKQYMTYLERMIIQQEDVIRRAEQFAESKRIELVAAMKERKMVETLKEHEYEEYIIEENKAEQKTIDEVVSYRYGKSEE